VIQLLANERGAGQPLARGGALLRAPIHELARDLFDFAMLVNLMVGQDVPHDHQQFARNRHDRFLPPDAVPQAVEDGSQPRLEYLYQTPGGRSRPGNPPGSGSGTGQAIRIGSLRTTSEKKPPNPQNNAPNSQRTIDRRQ
jgi:hypothetical protein